LHGDAYNWGKIGKNDNAKKNFVYLHRIYINDSIMVVVTGRDFRANTAKYVDVAISPKAWADTGAKVQRFFEF